MSRSALLVALLCVGCAETTGPAPSFVAPVAPHRPSAWQQFCEQAFSVPQASALVTARGADGFELVAMYNGALCYKRPTPETSRPVGPSAPAPSPTGGASVPVIRDPGF